jgi:hypothetical protein
MLRRMLSRLPRSPVRRSRLGAKPPKGVDQLIGVGVRLRSIGRRQRWAWFTNGGELVVPSEGVDESLLNAFVCNAQAALDLGDVWIRQAAPFRHLSQRQPE